jgi:hypothetical protein
MPCNDWSDSPSELRSEIGNLRKQLAERDAMLCGIVHAVKNDAGRNYMATIEREVDWEEAGVSFEDFTAWWAAHQKVDKARRDKESRARRAAMAAAEKESARRALLARLTPEERALLGVKE